MNIETLRQFQTVARTENLTKAAEILHISQPTLSRSLKQLQDELGCSLFNYEGRGIRINRFGKMYLEHVNEALAALEDGEQKIRKINSPASGTVRISCLYSMGCNFIPYLLKDFLKDYPGVNIKLYQYGSADQLSKLYNDDLDFCFCTDIRKMDVHSKLNSVVVLIEDLYVIVNRSHPLASKDSVELHELNGQDFISYNDKTFFKQELNAVFEKFDVHPNTVMECSDDGTVAGFVGANMGVAVIPPVFTIDQTKVKALSISYPVCQRTMCMAWKTSTLMRPAPALFHDYVLKWLPIDKKYIAPSYLYPQ